MTCNPERVTGYVDGALDAESGAEVEAHLASCDACREQAAAETSLRGQVRGLPAPEVPGDLERTVRKRVQRLRTRAVRLLVPLAAGVLAVLVWAHGRPGFVAWELARDHRQCFGEEALPAQVWSSDPGPIIAWFGRGGTVLPAVPASVNGLELVGARYCRLLDRRVAHLYYAAGDRHLSLYVVPGAVRLQRAFVREGAIRVRLRRLGGVTVGLVAEHGADVEGAEAAFVTTVADLRY